MVPIGSLVASCSDTSSRFRLPSIQTEYFVLEDKKKGRTLRQTRNIILANTRSLSAASDSKLTSLSRIIGNNSQNGNPQEILYPSVEIFTKSAQENSQSPKIHGDSGINLLYLTVRDAHLRNFPRIPVSFAR